MQLHVKKNEKNAESFLADIRTWYHLKRDTKPLLCKSGQPETWGSIPDEGKRTDPSVRPANAPVPCVPGDISEGNEAEE
jgi:hypothetical protein